MSIQTDIANIAKNQLSNGATKYRTWYYGKNLTGVAWCAVFVSWCANQTQQLNKCIVKTDGAGCFAREGVPKGFGDWYEAKRYVEPQVGDIITFRDWGNNTYTDKYHADHVGLIVGVSKASDNTYNITTVEGNTGGSNDTSSVNMRTYNSKNGYVYAYYRPNYINDTEGKNESEDNYMECKKGDINVFVLSVKALLQQARRLGIIKTACDNSQGFGDGTEKAVLEFQKYAGLTQDAIVGEKTVSALRTAIEKNLETAKKALGV